MNLYLEETSYDEKQNMKCLQGCTLFPCLLLAGNKQKSNYNPADAKHKQPPFKQIGTSLSTHGFEQTKNI